MTWWSATWLVAKREATERARTRAYIVSTVLTLVILGGGAAIATLVSFDDAPRFDVAVTGPLPASFDEMLDGAAATAGIAIDTTLVSDPAAARAAVAEGRAHAAVIGPHTVVVEARRDTTVEAVLDAALRQAQFFERLGESGLPPEVVTGLLDGGRVDVESISEPPTTEGQTVAMISIMLLFFVITLYGQWVLMGVTEEKTTRVVEQVLSSISVRSLLAGKVLGLGALGLAQLVVIVVGGLIAFATLDTFELTSAAYPTAAWSILWFVLGFAFYGVLYAAAGSLVSRSEDAQATSTPVVLLSTASYLLTFAVIVPNPDSTLARLLSLVPTMAPIAFPARIGFAGVATAEILVGVAIMVASVVLATRLAARIYAGALLTSGSRVKLRHAWKAAGELV